MHIRSGKNSLNARSCDLVNYLLVRAMIGYQNHSAVKRRNPRKTLAAKLCAVRYDYCSFRSFHHGARYNAFFRMVGCNSRTGVYAVHGKDCPDSTVMQDLVFDGFAATCICHEYDHLDGILYTDRSDNVMTNEEYAEILKEQEEEER